MANSHAEKACAPQAHAQSLFVQNKWALPFAILAGIFIVSIRFTPYPLSYAVKALPILLLLFLALRTAPFRGRLGLMAAIFFSACGDVILDLNFKGAFIAGLASFLTAHVCYVVVFALHFRLQKKMLAVSLAGIVLPAAMAVFLWPHLGELKLPVAVYVTAIASMFLTSVNRSNINSSLIFGAMFFLISDSVLALNKFYAPIPAARYAIMATYYLAQYLIVTGLTDEQGTD